MIPRKKYYIGSKSCVENQSEWTHSTERQAIEAAKQLVVETEEDQYIVKVIAVAHYQHAPVVVTKLED